MWLRLGVLLFLSGFYSFSLFAQERQKGIPVNAWRSHLSYEDGLDVVEAGDRIYCATRTGLFYVDKRDNSTYGLSKVDGFSDVFATTLGYSEKHKMLFIGYRNGGIDIVQGGRIEYLNALMEDGVDEIIGFYLHEDKCYITHKLGVSVFDIQSRELKDSYSQIWSSPNCSTVTVKDVTIFNDSIYTVSTLGLLSAKKTNPVLGDCANWKKISASPATHAATFDNHLVIAFADGSVQSFNGSSWNILDAGTAAVNSMEVNHGRLIMTKGQDIMIWDNISTKKIHPSNQRNHVVLDEGGSIWMAVGIYSLIKENFNTGKVDFFRPNGPAHTTSYHITSYQDEIWVASGGLTEGGSSIFTNDGFYRYKGDQWESYSAANVSGWFEFKDITTVVKDPRNNHIWVGSVDSGLVEIFDKTMLSFYNGANSCIRSAEYPVKTYGSVAAMQFDADNNLWIANYRAPNQLAVLPAKGGCYSFNLGPKKSARVLLVDDFNNIWVSAPRENSLTVFSYGKTIENRDEGDEVKQLTVKVGEGHLPTESVFSLAKDREGQVWIGTIDGVAVFPDPSLVFSNYNYDAQRVWVTEGDESGYLLAGETITAIAVDGGNRKWLGTRRGAWLTTPDGSKILANFTTENSPLFSNLINTIAVNNTTGEVFFGTDKGIVSYRSTANEGSSIHENVYAYPNPVKPGYTGPIAITGLVTDARVKITDITGKLVFETRAEGGQAVWYGKNHEGHDANSGVYLVFSTNVEGTETIVTKIMVVR